MATKKTIAIIGATGNEGSAIAKSLAKGPYRLLLMGNNAEKLQILHNNISTGILPAELEIIDCPKEACWEADIIIFAIPYSAEAEIAPVISQYATGKVVIDIMAGDALSSQKELQALLPNSKVVKVYNISFSIATEDKIISTAIEGSDEEALQSAAEVLKAADLM